MEEVTSETPASRRKNPRNFRDDEWVQYVNAILANLGLVSVTTRRPLPGESFQLDITAFSPPKYCIIFECKTGGRDEFVRPKNEIEEFARKLKKIRDDQIKEFVKCHNLSRILSKFEGVSEEQLFRFSKRILVYAHNRLIKPDVKNDLEKRYSVRILDLDDVVYYYVLSSAIGKYARYEILKDLDVDFNEFSKGERESFDFILLKEPRQVIVNKPRQVIVNKILFNEEYYLFYMTPIELLKRAFVLRNPKPGWKAETYQRMLDKSRLHAIAKFYEGESADKPHLLPPIVVGLDKDEIRIKAGKLWLPKKHNSIAIIDGQHRLYGFCKVENEKLLYSLQIPIIGVKADHERQARIFLDINTNQKRVSKDVIYPVKTYMFGSLEPEALAYRVMEKLNEKGPLKGKVNICPLTPRQIKVISLIEYAGLKEMMKETLARKFRFSEKKADQYVDRVTRFLNYYLREVKTIFADEFDSQVLTVVGIGSLLRFLNYCLKLDLHQSQIISYLEKLKSCGFTFATIPKRGPGWMSGFAKMVCTLHAHYGGFLNIEKLTDAELQNVILQFRQDSKSDMIGALWDRLSDKRREKLQKGTKGKQIHEIISSLG